MYPIHENNIICELPRGGQLHVSIHGNVGTSWCEFSCKYSVKTYKWITNHSYKIEKQTKLEVPLSVSQC